MPRRNASLMVALDDLPSLLSGQAGVCTASQAHSLGISADSISRLLHSGRWRRAHRGVYLTEPHRAGLLPAMWAAHLALGPRSVVAGPTAGRYWGLVEGVPLADEPVSILLPDGCSRNTSGVRIRRVPHPEVRAHPARMPPVTTVEHTVLDLMADAGDDMAAVSVVLRACRMRITAPDRLLGAAATRPRLRRRALLGVLCEEVRAGVTSPLERLYWSRVCRPHGLPRGRAQAAAPGHGGRRVYRDIHLDRWGVLIELDGRLGHEKESAVLRDQFRDNAATLTGQATLRFGWLAVAGQACHVAGQVVTLLRARGWRGTPTLCRQGCPVESGGRVEPAA
jgi:hypothetical protein